MHQIILSISNFFQSLGMPGLVINAAIESCLPGFPIPPDIMLIAMSLTIPQKALFFALICTCGSVTGGVFGYLFGKYGGRPLFNHFFGKNIDKLDAVEKLYDKYGSFAVFFSAFSPIPYNIFTIASGILNMNILKFIAVSFCGRGGRFFLESIVLMLFGETIKQYMNYVIILVTVLMAAFFFIIYKKRHSIIQKDNNDIPMMGDGQKMELNEKTEQEICR